MLQNNVIHERSTCLDAVTFWWNRRRIASLWQESKVYNLGKEKNTDQVDAKTEDKSKLRIQDSKTDTIREIIGDKGTTYAQHST